jgi:hypothetical protein
MNVRDFDVLIRQLIEESFNTGYYAATLEKCILTQYDKDNYQLLQQIALGRRNRIKEQLITNIREENDGLS